MIYFFFVTMHMEDLTPLEATELLLVIFQSLFSWFLTWNQSQRQYGISCQKLNGITIPGNNKKIAGKGSVQTQKAGKREHVKVKRFAKVCLGFGQEDIQTSSMS